MKKTLLLLLFFVCQIVLAQIPSYYNDVNLTLTGLALKTELSNKVKNTHTTLIPYSSSIFDTWDALQLSDVNPLNSAEVLLIYGWENGSDGDITNDHERGINQHGGNSGDWNREHVFPKSLANPSLSTTNPGPGTDMQNLRPSDVSRNSDRGNLKFINSSGNSHATGGGWYPGDEWKGDVARIIMYMYLRYNGNGSTVSETQCLPTNVGIGSINTIDSNMVNLFLDWNVADPVSAVELQRNPVSESKQGNRNPFIDNPALATRSWGGTQAQDTWGTLAVANYTLKSFEVYPNPSNNHSINIVLKNSSQAKIAIYNISGQLIYRNKMTSKKQKINNLPTGFYMLKITTDKQHFVKKVIVK